MFLHLFQFRPGDLYFLSHSNYKLTKAYESSFSKVFVNTPYLHIHKRISLFAGFTSAYPNYINGNSYGTSPVYSYPYVNNNVISEGTVVLDE